MVGITLILGILTGVISLIPFVGTIGSLLISGPLSFGYIFISMKIYRNEMTNTNDLFVGFNDFGRTFSLYIINSILTFLWSLLLIIPGIIAAFRYSQAFYLRVDNPDWSSAKCLAESSRLMKGNKAKFFWLQLSFIGWYLLASILGLLMTIFVEGDIQLLIAGAICSIPVLFVDLYLMMTETVFYEILVGNLVVREESPFDQQL
jgi:uncharacterized membrane protein